MAQTQPSPRPNLPEPDLKKLWLELSSQLLQFIRRRVPLKQDAEDILQDVFIKSYERRGQLQNAEQFVGWLYRITSNAITDHFRQKTRQQRAIQLFTSEAHAQAPSEEEENLHDEAIRAELTVCIQPMMSKLPEHFREAIQLTELNGKTQKQAAEELGLSVSGMKSRVQRGRRQLKSLFDACCRFEQDCRGKVLDYTVKDPNFIQKCVSCDNSSDISPTPQSSE